MEDVKLMLHAQMDTSELNKDLTSVGQKAADGLQKTIKSVEDNVSRRMKDLGEDIAKLDAGKDMDVFSKATNVLEMFQNRLSAIGKDPSIDSVTARVYAFEKEMANAASNIIRLKGELDKIQEVKAREDMIRQMFGNPEQMKAKIQTLKTEVDNLRESLYAGRQGPNTNFMGAMDNWSKAIESYKNALKSLQGERAKLNERSDVGSEAWQKDLQEVNDEIQKITSALGNASKEFYRVGREANFGKTKEDIMETYNAMSLLVEKQKELNATNALYTQTNKASNSVKSMRSVSTILAEVSKYAQKLDSAEHNVRGIKNEVDGITESTKRLGSATKNAGDDAAHMRAQLRASERVMATFYTLAVDMGRAVKRVANIYKTIWSYLVKIVGVFRKLRDHIKKTADEHSKSWKQMLRDVIRYSLGIRSLFMLFRRLRNYIKEAFGAMAEQIPEVNRVLSELLSSFNMLKGSLATALEPILSAIAGWLDAIIAKFAQVLTYIGMFFAALSGRGYVYKANKSMTSFAKSAGDAADNVKELNKQLQGFDELNNLTTNDKKNDAGGGEPPLANFEKVEVPDWIKKLADLFKKIWNAIIQPIKEAWDKVKDYVIGSWKRAAKIILSFLLDIIRDFLRAWAQWGEPIFVRIFQIIGDIGMIIGNIALALKKAWNANDNGYKIWMAILEIVYKVADGIRDITLDMVAWTASLDLTPAMTAFREWLESCVPVAETLMDILYDIWNDALKPILDWTFNGENSGIAQLFRIFRDFNEKLDLPKLRKNLDKIWKAIGRFGKKVGEGLLEFLDRLTDRLANWINSDEFVKTCDKIAEFLDNIDVGDIVDDLEQVLRILKNIVEFAWSAIKVVIDHKDEILDVLEWISEHLKLVIGLVIGLKLAIDGLRTVMEVKRWLSFFKVAKAIADPKNVAAASSAGGTLVQSVFLGANSAWKSLGGLGGILKANFSDMGAMTAKEAGLFLGTNIVAGIGFGVASGLATLKVADIVAKYLGYEGGWKEVKEIVQKEVDDIVQIIKDGYIPAIEEMQNTARLNNYGDSAGAGRQMQEFHDTIIETNDDLRALNQTLEDNNVKVQGNGLLNRNDNIEALKQVNEGLAILEENGNDVNAMLSDLASKYGEVESGAYKYFDGLRSGKEAYVEVQNSMRDYMNTAKQTIEETPSAADIDKKFDQSMMGNLDRLPSNVAEKMRAANEEVNTSFNATSETVRQSTQEAIDAIDELQSYLDGKITWKEYIEGDFNEIDFSGMESKISDFNTNLQDITTDTSAWNDFGAEIPTSVSSGIDSTQTQAFDSMNNLASGMVDAFHDSALQFGSPSQTMIDFGMGIPNSLAQGITDSQDVAITAVSNFADAIVQRFTVMRNDIISIFNSLIRDMNTALSGLVTGVNTAMSNIQSSISGMKSSMNGFTSSVNSTYHANIPRLAKGAVIPPNNEFLAVLGDQKRGTNIESPLSTIVDAFNMANKGGNAQELALLQEQNDLLRQLLNKEFGISDDAIFKSVKRSNSQYRKQTGTSAFA